MLRHKSAPEGKRIVTVDGLIMFLYSAWLRGNTSVTVLLADHKSPAYVGCHPSSSQDLRDISTIVRNLARLAPITGAMTMIPDHADQAAFDPEKTRLQWLPVIQECAPTFTAEMIAAIERTEMYEMFSRADGIFDYVLLTGETAGYGNLAVKIDLAESIFGDFERMPVELFMALRNNHSTRVLVIPAESKLLAAGRIPHRIPRINMRGTVEEAAHLISKFWTPDGHVERPGVPQRPIRVWSPDQSADNFDADAASKFARSLYKDWQNVPAELTTRDGFVQLLKDWRNVAVVMCAGSSTDAPHVILINGAADGVS